MDALIAFLNQPIFLTLLSLTIGGYLLSLLADRRARKDKIRDQAVELLTEIGDDINAVISRIFGRLRANKMQVGKDSDLNEAIGNLFAKRLSIRVRSKAYLDSEQFYRQYDIIIWELRHVFDFMATLTDEYNKEQVVRAIQARKEHLGEVWPLKSERITSEGEPPFSELLSWTEMITDRATHLLSTYLKSALK